MQQYDIIVVGAGPAGSAAAWSAAQGGARVLLCEKSSFPRDKPCGDALTPRGVAFLRRMGITNLSRFVRVERLRGTALGKSYETQWPAREGMPKHGYVIPRTVLDEMLARKASEAGAELAEDTEVSALIVHDDVVRGVVANSGGRSDKLHADVTIIAGGSQCHLSAQMNNPNAFVGMAMRAEVEAEREDDSALEFYALPGKRGLVPGYGWVFPMGGGRVNVGVGVVPTYAGWRSPRLGTLMADFLDRLPSDWRLPSLPSLQETRALRAAPLPLGFSVWPPWRPGLMLIGDAAGVAKPPTGSGISRAIQSGLIAADVAIERLERNGPSDLSLYGERLNALWGKHYRRWIRFMRIAGRPPVINGFVWSVFSSTALMRTMKNLVWRV